MKKRTEIKNFYLDHSPIVKARRKNLRKELKNTTPTFLCPNCIGGHLFHDLGLEFRSPTVNLMFLQTDFYEFVMHLDDYLQGEFEFFQHEEYNVPCACLKAKGLKDIVVHFTHYETEEEALKKWNERCKRIDKDNLFVFIQERDGLNREQIENLSKLNVRGLLVFSANPYDDIPYILQLKHCQPYGKVVHILDENIINGSWDYEKYFDFVKWFNEADGGDYDVKPFSRLK